MLHRWSPWQSGCLLIPLCASVETHIHKLPSVVTATLECSAKARSRSGSNRCDKCCVSDLCSRRPIQGYNATAYDGKE
jgi:hypothetical protein